MDSLALYFCDELDFHIEIGFIVRVVSHIQTGQFNDADLSWIDNKISVKRQRSGRINQSGDIHDTCRGNIAGNIKCLLWAVVAFEKVVGKANPKLLAAAVEWPLWNRRRWAIWTCRRPASVSRVRYIRIAFGHRSTHYNIRSRQRGRIRNGCSQSVRIAKQRSARGR